ncbi:hypothetical protein D1872_281630 [compost metagenome]
MLYEILIFGIHTHYTTTTAFLTAIGGNRKAFDISRMGYSNNNIFTRNEILIQNTLFTHCNFSATFISETPFKFIQLFANDVEYQMLVRQNLTVFRNLLY